MEAFKLFKTRKDGSIGPLFINRKQHIPLNKWLEAEEHLTKGFAFRPGWHCTAKPIAPHLKLTDDRAWFKVEIEEFKECQRPSSQGGLWFLANKIKVIEKL